MIVLSLFKLILKQINLNFSKAVLIYFYLISHEQLFQK